MYSYLSAEARLRLPGAADRRFTLALILFCVKKQATRRSSEGAKAGAALCRVWARARVGQSVVSGLMGFGVMTGSFA